MRKSKKKSGFTKISNVVFDLILPSLSTAEQSVFMRIYRQTAGWGKETDKISLSQFQETTGIKDKKTISAALGELSKRSLITSEGERTQVKEYGIDWDQVTKIHEEWEYEQLLKEL